MTPEHWRQAPVSTFGEIVAGKAKNTEGNGENRPYLRVANVFDGRIDITDVLEMPFSDAEFDRYRLEPGDVLLNEGQSLELVGRCAMYRGEYPAPCGIQNALVRFRAGPQMTAIFAEQLFRWCQHTGVFAEIATQTTSIAHLGVKRFAGLEVAVPPLGEQKKIAAILSSVDDAIEASRAVIDHLGVVKKAMMAEFLTEPTRLAQSGEARREGWRLVRLAEIANVVRGSTPRPAKDPRYFGGDHTPWITVGELSKDEWPFLPETTTALTAAGAERSRLLRRGTVVLSNSGFGCGVPKILELDGCANDGIAAFLELTALQPLFLYYVLASMTEHLRASVARGVDQPNMNTTLIGEIVVPAPPSGEQRRIATSLLAADERLRAERETLKAMRDLKSALMSVLLTGEVRVSPDEDAT